MPGFFQPYELPQTPLHRQREGCPSCGLYKKCRSPRMDYTGKGRKGILLVGESHGEKEDEKGEQFVGPSGVDMLWPTLADLGIRRNVDTWSINAVRCRTTSRNGKPCKPTSNEIAHCRPLLFKTIKELQPRAIIALGAAAVEALVGHRWIGGHSGLGGINRWRGWAIPDRDLGCWLLPVYHPAHVLRSEEKEPQVHTIFKQDMAAAIDVALNKPFPKYEDEKSRIQYLRTQDEIETFLTQVTLQEDFCTFDFETTGLRPLRHGQKILTCAVAGASGSVGAFAWPRKRSQLAPVRRLLTARGLGKAGFNIAFEQWWAAEKLGCQVYPWIWDGMQTAHVLDNRVGICSLKFQVYVNFGVVDYDSHMKEWLESTPEQSKRYGANALNSLERFCSTKEGLNATLTYNGLDALYEMMLVKRQMEQFGSLPKHEGWI